MFSAAGSTPLGFLALKWIYFHFVFFLKFQQNVGEKKNISLLLAFSLFLSRSGQSNPTFHLQKGFQAYVLRKKPPGLLLPKAHKV